MVNLHCCLHLLIAHGSATADASVMAPFLAMVNLHCCLHLMSAHGSATANASVMAPSPFAVKLSVGAVGAVEAVGGGGALSQEVVLLVVVLSPASPSPGGGAVGGGAAACSPTVSQEEEEVVWAGRGACPHDSHARAPRLSRTRGAVPATASGQEGAYQTLDSSRDTLAWRRSS